MAIFYQSWRLLVCTLEMGFYEEFSMKFWNMAQLRNMTIFYRSWRFLVPMYAWNGILWGRINRKEVLNSRQNFLIRLFEIADLPPHELKLKKNTIIMLCVYISEGMCNGTRLIVIELCNNVVSGGRLLTYSQICL